MAMVALGEMSEVRRLLTILFLNLIRPFCSAFFVQGWRTSQGTCVDDKYLSSDRIVEILGFSLLALMPK